MPTLVTANIQTVNATTDLTISSGNTAAPGIILYSNNSGIAVINGTANVVLSINASSNVVLGSNLVGNTSSLTSVANVSGTGQLVSSGNITPTIITSNTTAYNPTGLANTFTIRLQSNSTANGSNTTIAEPFISGIVPSINNQIITLSNIGAQKIQLRNEDSVNETTAANRFSIPNNVWLYGYQSIQLIYDGIKSRWTPLTFLGASPSLSLGYDYVNTITLRTDYKFSLTKGFFSGGANPTVVTTADRCTYSSETTAAVSGANLSQGKSSMGAVGNADKGFFLGGNFPSYPATVTTVDRTTRSSETTAAVSGANLSQGRAPPKSLGNSDKGFISGGETSTLGTVSAISDRCIYSTETIAAVSGANLSQARSPSGGAGNSDKGFVLGGSGGGPIYPGVTTTDKTTHSTEVTVAVSGANISQARAFGISSGNLDKGFAIGGYLAPSGAGSAVADRISYASETTAAVTGANLSQARWNSDGAGNDAKGFLCGGQIPGSRVATADRCTYSTETTAAVTGANLSQAKGGVGAV